ncbi:UNVERIFIED_CONTAM: pyocin knob domain-containing protein, partial [Kocuria sp. CPCC 205274]
LQVNSNVVCGDGETNNTDKLQDNKYSGKSFMVAKPKTVNSTTGVTSNGAPAAMEYDWAVCNDFYGTWTPTGGIEGKTRVQTIYDKNAIWVRGYHHQDATWTPWKRVNSQFYNNVSGIDANTITTDGSYFYFKDTAQVTTPNTPHIDSPEDSDVYFLTVNADDSGKEIVQTVLSPKTNSRFDRYCVNGSWSRWWNSTATIDFDTAPAGFNLDNETNPGFWNCELSTTTGTPASLRSGKALVSIYADAFGNVKQELVYASLQATWVRYKSPVFTWSQWVRLATANDQGVVDFAHGGTGGNSKAAAQTSLGIEMPSNGSIAPGINLDQFKGDGYKGYWRQPLTTAASNAGANYPVPEAGLLTVEVSGANGNGTTQTYRTWETNQEFTRTWQAVQGNVNMGKWSPWHTKLNAFVIDNFFLKPDGSQDPDAAKNGWDKAHPPTRGVMTNIYFHPQPSKLKN